MVILLPQFPKCWDSICELPYPTLAIPNSYIQIFVCVRERETERQRKGERERREMRVSCSPVCPQAPSIAEGDLGFLIRRNYIFTTNLSLCQAGGLNPRPPGTAYIAYILLIMLSSMDFLKMSYLATPLSTRELYSFLLPAEVTTAHPLHSPGFYQHSHKLAQTDGSLGAEKKAGVGEGKCFLLSIPSLSQLTTC